MNIPPLHILVIMLMVLVLVWTLDRIIRRTDNSLDWSDLVSSLGRDGKPHASIDKIGKCIGVLLAFYIPVLYAHSDKFEPTGGALLLGASLLYLGGVAAYSANLKSKRGDV